MFPCKLASSATSLKLCRLGVGFCFWTALFKNRSGDVVGTLRNEGHLEVVGKGFQLESWVLSCRIDLSSQP